MFSVENRISLLSRVLTTMIIEIFAIGSNHRITLGQVVAIPLPSPPKAVEQNHVAKDAENKVTCLSS